MQQSCVISGPSENLINRVLISSHRQAQDCKGHSQLKKTCHQATTKCLIQCHIMHHFMSGEDWGKTKFRGLGKNKVQSTTKAEIRKVQVQVVAKAGKAAH